MPIDVKELDEAQRPLRDRILDLLRNKKDLAFSAQDVFLALNFPNDASAQMAFMLTPTTRQAELVRPVKDLLDALCAEQLARAADLRGTRYYAATGK